MREATKNFKKTTIIKLSIIVLTVISLLWSLTSDRHKSFDFSRDNTFLLEGFVQILDGERIELDNVGDFQKVGIGESLILETVIPDIPKSKNLLFYSKDLEVAAYIDDVNVYNFKMQEDFKFLKTPGNKWNCFSIPEEMSGHILRLEFVSNFPNRFRETVTELNLVNQNATLTIMVMKHGFHIFMGIFIFIMAIISYVNSVIWKRLELRIYFFRLANFYLCVSIWLFAVFSIFDYFISKPLFSYVTSMVTAVLCPVVLYEFVKFIYAKKSRLVTFMGYVVWVGFSLQMILQFVFKVSFLDVMLIDQVIYVAGSFVCIYLIIKEIIENKKKCNFRFVSMLAMFIGGLLEILLMVVAPERIDLIGVFSISGLLVYLVVNQIHITHTESQLDVKALELTENYNKLQNTTLMQQIKAHYFFNTLNTISALCKYDAKEADRAISIFATYMRSYMQMINKKENIPFKKELELVQSSLDIERLRFPDSFTYEISLGYTDFELPPLSVQIIVENALIHGLRKIPKDGRIKIETKKHSDFVEIIISDNGMGFDVSLLEQTESIGLRNLENRLKLMANGEVKIESEVGKGTRATIKIKI